MPTWGNTDAHNQKPKFDADREVRENIQLYVATGNTLGNTIITVTAFDGGPNTLANVGVAAGQFVYFWANGFGANGGQNGNGIPGIFASNTTVASVSGNTVTLANPLFGTVNTGWGVEFDKGVAYKATSANTYNQDTILITASRGMNVLSGQANLASGISANQVGNFSQGWVHIQKKVNNDGTVRYLKETLVALANSAASNVSSGNTSFGGFVSGL